MAGWCLGSHAADTTPHMMRDAVRTMSNVHSLDNSFSWGPPLMSGMIYRPQEILESSPDKLTPVG